MITFTPDLRLQKYTIIMFTKGTKLYSILTATCPRCQEESMFKNKNPYILSQALSMHDTCGHCGLKYKMEPSFFYGAMYVSYAVGIAFAVAAFVISYFVFNAGIDMIFASIIGTLIVFMPIILRLSRTIWINFFVSYNPEATKK